MKGLKGKVALVTGGAQGIGEEICEHLSSEGVEIAVCDINKEQADIVAEKLSVSSVKAKAFFMNVADSAGVEETIQNVIDEFERIDILVNNAGITRDNLMIRMKDED